MTTDMSRRKLLAGTAGAGIGIVLAGSIEAVAGTGTALAATRSARGFGELVPDPAGLLALPPGFSYRIVAHAGETTLDDVVGPTTGFTPSDADGTAAFARPGGSTLVNNHEISGTEPYGVPPLPGLTYDAERPRRHHDHRASTATATGCASTSASPARTTTAPAASPRGAPG